MLVPACHTSRRGWGGGVPPPTHHPSALTELADLADLPGLRGLAGVSERTCLFALSAPLDMARLTALLGVLRQSYVDILPALTNINTTCPVMRGCFSVMRCRFLRCGVVFP